MCDKALNNYPTLLDNGALQQSYGLLGGGCMRFRALIVGNGRLQGFVFAAALVWAVVLLVLATGARGESAVNIRGDRSRRRQAVGGTDPAGSSRGDEARLLPRGQARGVRSGTRAGPRPGAQGSRAKGERRGRGLQLHSQGFLRAQRPEARQPVGTHQDEVPRSLERLQGRWGEGRHR